jgi:hypothetical protein
MKCISETDRRFGGEHCLLFESRNVSQERIQKKQAAIWTTLDVENKADIFLRNVGLSQSYTKLQSVVLKGYLTHWHVEQLQVSWGPMLIFSYCKIQITVYRTNYCDTVWSGRHVLTLFRRMCCLHLQDPKVNRTTGKQLASGIHCLLLTGFLLSLLFSPEDGGSKFLRNVDKFLLDFKASYFRR